MWEQSPSPADHVIQEVSGRGEKHRLGSQPPWPGTTLETLDSLARVFLHYVQGWTDEYYIKKLSRGCVIHLSHLPVTSTP